MKSHIALFDIDKTIYSLDSIFEIIPDQISKNVIAPGTWDLAKEGLVKYKNGQSTYNQTVDQLMIIWASSLTDIEYDRILDLTKRFFLDNEANFFEYFRNIISKLKREFDIYLVTAEPQFISEAIVEQFGLTGYLSTNYEIVDGKFTGKIASSLSGNKSIVRDLFIKYPDGLSIAVGDSENDIDMLALVDHPFCFQPTNELENHAKKYNWPIIDKDTAEKEIQEVITSHLLASP